MGISGRHVHLNTEDLKTLFGSEGELHSLKDLSQTGQFAAKETVLIAGPKGAIPNVRVLGPVRGATQVELSQTDCFHLGIPIARRNSGDTKNTPGLVLVGPRGSVILAQGAMVAMRHIHMAPADAAAFGVEDMDIVRCGVFGERAVVFEQVLVRVHPTFVLELHVDTDEANASGLANGDLVAMIPPGAEIPESLDELRSSVLGPQSHEGAH